MPEHPTDAHFSFTFVFKQALKEFLEFIPMRRALHRLRRIIAIIYGFQHLLRILSVTKYPSSLEPGAPSSTDTGDEISAGYISYQAYYRYFCSARWCITLTIR